MSSVYLVQVEDRASRKYLGVWHFSSEVEYVAFPKDPNMNYVPLGNSNCLESWADEVNDHGPIWDGVL